MAMILYGLTIGKNPQAGTSFIKQGLRTYPFVAEPDSLWWQPYHVLVRDLEPWLVTSDSEKVLNYEQLMHSARIYTKISAGMRLANSLKKHLYLNPTFLNLLCIWPGLSWLNMN